jgi:cell division protein FtsI (penicillin-binding protein 3)
LWSAFCVVAFVLSLFAARLVQLQGIDENDYAALARAKGAQTITLDATRGPIYDRFGARLAESVTASRLVADPTYTSAHAPQIAAILHHRLGTDYLDTVAKLRTKNTRYVELARHLAPRVASSVVTRLNHLNLPGVYTAHDTLRVYPGGDVAANLVGFVGASDQGMYGLEESLNSTLRGENGHATYQVEGGQVLPLADSQIKEPREGTGVRLTIDQDLQFLAQRRVAEAVKQFDADSGVAVILDARTSQVLSLADYPSYNANDFTRSDEPVAQSSALYDAYEPGSVEKVLTFSALIDAGYVTPTTKVVVPPSLPVGGYTVNDDFGHGTLHLTTTGILAESSNIGTVRSASKMPNAQLYAYLKKFGIGDQLNLPLHNTAVGTLTRPGSWPAIQRADIDFGQGVSVNALQMAAAITAVAHGGVYTAPSLIQGTVGSDGTFTPAAAPARHRVVSAQTAQEVTRMMEAVVRAPGGTGPAAAIPGYQVAGKTGTAQRANHDCGCYDGSNTVSFAGFAPADNPRFVIYVVVQNPRAAGSFGATVAAPVFHDLMVAALQKYGVPPTGRQQPLLPTTW